MMQSMSARELEGWKAYYELEPSFDERADWLIASIVQMLHNIAAGKGRQKPMKDFLLKFEEAKPQTVLTPDMQRRMFIMYLDGQRGDTEV